MARPSLRAALALRNIASPIITRPTPFISRYPKVTSTTLKTFTTTSLHLKNKNDLKPEDTVVAETIKTLEGQLKTIPATHTRNLFDLSGKVYVVTGGGRGLGLTLAEALAEAGAIVHCLDRLPEPDAHFLELKERLPATSTGELHYSRVDVRNIPEMNSIFSTIASQNKRLDGLIAAAGVQLVKPALDYDPQDLKDMMDINYGGVFFSATSAARAMQQHGTPGSIVLIASMSGLIANKGLISPVYNSSKAAVIQLGRNLAMEWGKQGIRVNSLSPGHIVTPMVKENFKDEPWLEELWTKENMLGRLSAPEEFKGAALFLCSEASSFMTGGNLVIDGGHTAW